MLADVLAWTASYQVWRAPFRRPDTAFDREIWCGEDLRLGPRARADRRAS